MQRTCAEAWVSKLVDLLEAHSPLATPEICRRLGISRASTYTVLQVATKRGLIGAITAPHPMWRPEMTAQGKAIKVWVLARDLLSPQALAALAPAPALSRAEQRRLQRHQQREAAKAEREARRVQALKDKRAADLQAAADEETAVFEALFDAPGPQTKGELAALCVLPEHTVAAALLRMIQRGEVARLTPHSHGYPLRLDGTHRHAWVIAWQARPAGGHGGLRAVAASTQPGGAA